MVKSLVVLIGGIFAGAVGMEIIRRKYPNAIDKVYAKTREVGVGAKEAFKAGYQNAVRPQEAAEPSA
jgi:hypothetical protein